MGMVTVSNIASSSFRSAWKFAFTKIYPGHSEWQAHLQHSFQIFCASSCCPPEAHRMGRWGQPVETVGGGSAGSRNLPACSGGSEPASRSHRWRHSCWSAARRRRRPRRHRRPSRRRLQRRRCPTTRCWSPHKPPTRTCCVRSVLSTKLKPPTPSRCAPTQPPNLPQIWPHRSTRILLSGFNSSERPRSPKRCWTCDQPTHCRRGSVSMPQRFAWSIHNQASNYRRRVRPRPLGLWTSSLRTGS